LLISLADLAVELGYDDSREVVLSNRQLGDRFIQLYWRQAQPYGTGRPGAAPGVLVQNNGTQAAVVSAIGRFRAAGGVATPQLARTRPEYRVLLTRVSNTVSSQPIRFLQNFGGATDEFLYERAGAAAIRLKPGVACCLRRFYPLVQQLARSHWVGHVRANHRNRGILGAVDDLEQFLFETSRQSLLELGQRLRDLDGEICFYCRRELRAVDTDHFIPFSQYPRDLAHNFVLAHPECNRSKSDTLAARPHLERWLRRLASQADSITAIGRAAGIVADAETIRRVALWGYTSAIESGGHGWLRQSTYEPIDVTYSACFAT
jgi:5-methylcytosine-specific restriction endonuclease McrA